MPLQKCWTPSSCTYACISIRSMTYYFSTIRSTFSYDMMMDALDVAFQHHLHNRSISNIQNVPSIHCMSNHRTLRHNMGIDLLFSYGPSFLLPWCLLEYYFHWTISAHNHNRLVSQGSCWKHSEAWTTYGYSYCIDNSHHPIDNSYWRVATAEKQVHHFFHTMVLSCHGVVADCVFPLLHWFYCTACVSCRRQCKSS